MTRYTAYEQAYKNGFEAGKQAAVANLRKLKELPEEMRVRAIAAVNAVQTEDIVEVVRCKDCKYWTGTTQCDTAFGMTVVMPDDFCSFGERK